LFFTLCRFFAVGSPLVTEGSQFLSSPESIPMRGDASRSQFANPIRTRRNSNETRQFNSYIPLAGVFRFWIGDWSNVVLHNHHFNLRHALGAHPFSESNRGEQTGDFTTGCPQAIVTG
jgi:hypothetical protein